MTVSDEEIRQRLRLGEDSAWEFKQVEFSGDRPTSPRRDDLADEMVAFANANGGMLLCGITDDGSIQGMSPEQMAAVDRLLVEVSTDLVKPALRIDVHHRELDGRMYVLAEVPQGDTLHEQAGRAFIRVGRPSDDWMGMNASGWHRTAHRVATSGLTDRSCRRRASKRSASVCGSLSFR